MITGHYLVNKIPRENLLWLGGLLSISITGTNILVYTSQIKPRNHNEFMGGKTNPVCEQQIFQYKFVNEWKRDPYHANAKTARSV